MKIILSAVIIVLLFLGSEKMVGQSLSGPDGRLSIHVNVIDGRPFYEVTYDGHLMLLPSPIGMKTNVGDFSRDLSLKEVSAVAVIDQRYSLKTIKTSEVHYRANEAVFSFEQNGKAVFDLNFRVSNNDVGFRYKVHPQGERLVCVIHQEETGFVLPQGSTTFLCPQMTPMTAFARTAPSYETAYTADDEMGKNGEGAGYTFPALFRVKDQGWVLISETGVDSRYCASRLMGHANGLYTIGFPQPEENNGNGISSPGIPLPGYTPWRTITVGASLAPIVETTVPFDLVEPLYEPSTSYNYGRSTWSWIIKMDPSINFEEQKNYVDFSAALGYEFVLVDNWWDTQIGRDKIETLAQYAASKHVSLLLWYNTNGYWNDAPQGPRDMMNRSFVRRAEMAWLKRIGVKGIKVDFFGGDKQVTMQLYEDILSDANDFRLLVIFHGCTLPRGWERMFPNYASSEAVLASEMLHFSQQRCDLEAFSAALHPFIRNAVGSMDFGGSALNQFYNATNAPNVGTRRMTSDVFALATAVLFQSPVQHFALAPNNIIDAPAWAVEFMKSVPTTWDEVRFIDGYPGKYVILARRKGNKWFVAGINASGESIRKSVHLPMFAPGQMMRLYNDDESLVGRCDSLKQGKRQLVSLVIPTNGGVLITD